MDRDRINFFFLNMGHFLDHFCMLVFATVAALRLATEWNMTYAELIPYATPGFVAFGVCAIPVGWLADKWSREGMMTIFFIGIGLCTILTAFAQLVVGYLVDRYSVRVVFAAVAGFQAVFFAIMLNLTGVAALLVAFGFMLVVFGQIPINDVLVARITRSEWRSRIYAVRYIVTLSVAATAVPIIAGVHASWGFSALFLVMAGAATLIFFAVLLLPRTAAVTGRPAAAPAE